MLFKATVTLREMLALTMHKEFSLNLVCSKIQNVLLMSIKKNKQTHTRMHTFRHTLLSHLDQPVNTPHVSRLTPVTVLLSCELIVKACAAFLTEHDKKLILSNVFVHRRLVGAIILSKCENALCRIITRSDLSLHRK